MFVFKDPRVGCERAQQSTNLQRRGQKLRIDAIKEPTRCNVSIRQSQTKARVQHSYPTVLPWQKCM